MKENNLIANLSFQFALKIIELTRILTSQREFVLANQLLKSGTSIGANVEEAIAAQSKKDFVAKLSIASKESREARYWLNLLDKSKTCEVDYAPYLSAINSIIKVLTRIIKTCQYSSEMEHSEKR